MVAIAFSIGNSIYAQEKNSVGIGLNLNQFQNDFGIGIHVVSPYFFNNSVAVKLGGNIQWLQHANVNETTWNPYGNMQVGFRGRHSIIENTLFVYGEGGTVLLVPTSTLSNRQTIVGGYGLLGFELLANNRLSYFIELGGMGTDAKADKLISKPIFSNGFTISTGVRFRL